MSEKKKSAGRLAWYTFYPGERGAFRRIDSQPEFDKKADALKWIDGNHVSGEYMLVREVARVRMVIPPRPAPQMQAIPLDGDSTSALKSMEVPA